MTELAMYGGPRVRDIPYPTHDTMIGREEEEAVIATLRRKELSGFSGRPGDRFLGGPNVRRLEDGFRTYFGTTHAVSFNSATSALHSAVAAVGVGPGDEVIVPPTSMSASATCVVMANAVPVFADIEDETFCLDPNEVEKKITPRTKAIIVVNLFGHPARLEALKEISSEHELALIEDNAQSPGAAINGKFAGTIGDIGVLSLNYHKAIQTGEGGVAVTNNDKYAQRMQLIRNHGEVVLAKWTDDDLPDLENIVGWNYRMTEIEAAIGMSQIEKLDKLLEVRRDLANSLTAALQPYKFLIPPFVRQNCSHSYYFFTMRFLPEEAGYHRDVFVRAMQAEGVAISPGYEIPIYRYPMYQNQIAYGDTGCPFRCPHYTGEPDYAAGLCPTAERLYDLELVTTDICKFPNGAREVKEFVEAVHKVADNQERLSKEA
ncbi:MAG: DegT/DnrJ/EryC1/StrS aminotransferase [Magnetovibrio sp.]|nr:DegT/DnrJ/EryC1/StrS aminotransferase [Magnetovibrio sp.]